MEVSGNVNGIPYKAEPGVAPPLCKNGDASTYPVRRSTVHVRVFTLDSEDAAEEYSKTLSDITDSTYKQLSQDRVDFNASSGCYVAFVRWIELWMEPASASNSFNGVRNSL